MTDPLVPPEVDLRDFEYMPLKVARLRKSKEWLLAKKDPSLAFYSMNLWTAAWHEVPAASLEDDDEVLADLAMCPFAKWRKVRELVLRKWVKCSDGRLYHPVVAEVALESWAVKLANRKRTNAATEARRLRDEQRNDQREKNATSNVTTDVTSPPRSPREVKRSEEKGIKSAVGVTPTIPGEANPKNENGADEKTVKVNGHPKQNWRDPTWVNATATAIGMHRLPMEDDNAWTDRVISTVQAKRVQDQAKVNRGIQP